MTPNIRLIISVISGTFLTLKEIAQKTGIKEKDVEQGLYQIRKSNLGYLSSRPGRKGFGGYSHQDVSNNDYSFTCSWNKNWRAANNMPGLSSLL